MRHSSRGRDQFAVWLNGERSFLVRPIDIAGVASNNDDGEWEPSEYPQHPDHL